MNHADKKLGSMGSIKNTVYFGYFTSLGIVVAFVANVTLTPALIRLAARLFNAPRPSVGPPGARLADLVTDE